MKNYRFTLPQRNFPFVIPGSFKMIHLFFNFCYLILLTIFFPYLLFSAIFKGKYREGFGQKFLGNAPKLSRNGLSGNSVSPRNSSVSMEEHSFSNISQNTSEQWQDSETRRLRVWIHAVSVGEVNLAAAVLKEWERRHPEFEFVISTTSRTGMELARKKFSGKTVFYAPLDFSWAVRRALKRIQPDVLVLVELEIWPNLLLTAQKRNVPIFVVNGRLGEKSYRNYQRIRPLIRRVMRTLSLTAAQDQASADRFAALGVPDDRVFNVGSIKYDGAQMDRQNEKTRRLAALWDVQPEDRIFLAGSTQEPEEEMALEVFRRLAPRHPELRLILVPRHPERFPKVAKLLEASEFSFDKRSELPEIPEAPIPEVPQVSVSGKTAEAQESGKSRKEGIGSENQMSERTRNAILLVDTIGELGGWWGTSRVGFVGGSMGSRGGQNMLEPAAYGTAVSFGPNTWNFKDIVSALLTHEAAVVVKDTDEMENFVQRALEEPEFAETLGRNARELILRQQGALRKTMELFDQFMQK